jgi:quinol monooxygenase YgiN
MIRVIAIVTAKPGLREELLSLFKANVPAVLAEAGCLEYVPVIDASRTPAKMGPDTFVVIETWESMEALVAHGASPHMLAYREASKDLVAGAAVHFLSPA